MVAESCGQPLSSLSPITFTIIDPDGAGADPIYAFGYAKDDVTSVSFTVAGRPETAAVSPLHLFVFQGPSEATIEDFSSPTVLLSDGTLRVAE
jgi:hypothetical protein